MYKYVYGVMAALVLGGASFLLARLPIFSLYSISPLLIAIIIGMVFGNGFQKHIPESFRPGIAFSQKRLLRLGIVLYGFFITFQQIFNIGFFGLIVDVLIICTTFLLGIWFGAKILKIDKPLAILVSSGASICGAAAVLATEPIVKAKPHQTAVAVASVVIFGTLAMFLYPMLYRFFEINNTIMGVYTGATVHEVAQVVAAGNAMSESIATDSVIVKLTRVMLLAPFLIALGLFFLSGDGDGKPKGKVTIPWFALFFIVVAGINSFHIVPDFMVEYLKQLSILLLAVAMGALGINTNFEKVKNVGFKPLVLAGVLFLYLMIGGFGLTVFVKDLLA